jgi:hypothetical protein
MTYIDRITPCFIVIKQLCKPFWLQEKEPSAKAGMLSQPELEIALLQAPHGPSKDFNNTVAFML